MAFASLVLFRCAVGSRPEPDNVEFCSPAGVLECYGPNVIDLCLNPMPP